MLNAANEVAVDEFLAGSLKFADITGLVEAALDAAVRQGWVKEPQDVEEALFIDHNTRLIARDILLEIAAKAS